MAKAAVPFEVRKQRERALRPLFLTLEQQGRSRLWLARELGMPKARLWSYEHGAARLPSGLIEQICAKLGIPARLFYPAGVPDELLQRPRTRLVHPPRPPPPARLPPNARHDASPG